MYKKKDLAPKEIQYLNQALTKKKTEYKPTRNAFFIYFGFLCALSIIPPLLDSDWWVLPVFLFLFALVSWNFVHAGIRRLCRDIKERKKEVIEGVVVSKQAKRDFYAIEIAGDNIEVSFQFCTECKVGDTVVIERACKSKINITERCED